MKNLFWFLGTLMLVSPAFSAVESNLGAIKAVKITQKVEASQCEARFERKSYTSLCKIPVFTLKDTDLMLSISNPITMKINQANNVVLRATLTANVEGFYWFIFERKTTSGDLVEAPTYEEIEFVMDDLTSQLENGELTWKLYRVQTPN